MNITEVQRTLRQLRLGDIRLGAGRHLLVDHVSGPKPISYPTADHVENGPALRHLALILLLGVVAYLPYLTLPFISDDYTQLYLARLYGPSSGWPALFTDPLYRCRATSLLLTYWTERAFGLAALPYNLTSLLVHLLNAGLVLLLGSWRAIGWRVAAVAAAAFAVLETPQEAVAWYAALPELLVFTGVLSSLLCWLRCLQGRQRVHESWYVLSLVAFGLALLSKESAVAVVGLNAVALLVERPDWRRHLWRLAPFVLVSAAYAVLIFRNQANHLHLNDGTFSLAAPFWLVLPTSLGRLLWPWGLAAVTVLAIWRASVPKVRLLVVAAWTLLALLPYSFLTYMARVPSRHLYLASVGLCLLLAMAFVSMRHQAKPSFRWLALVLAGVFLAHNIGYLWTRKLVQYRERAAVTERFLSFAREQDGPIVLRCFPGSPWTLQHAAVVMLGRPEDSVLHSGERRPVPAGARGYCELAQQ